MIVPHGKSRCTRARPQRGMVLPTVLWLMVILLVVALGLSYDTQMEARSARNTDNQARAYYAALSGLERLAAELDEGGVTFTTVDQPWTRLDSTEEQLLPEADQYGFMVLAEDNCGKLDLNRANQAALAQIPVLTEEQVTALLEYRDGTAESGSPQGTGSSQGTTTSAAAVPLQPFRSVDDLLLVPGFSPELLYGTAVWQERLSPAERFRQDWSRLDTTGQTAEQEETSLTGWLCVGSRARQVASDGLPRTGLGAVTRTDLRDRLEGVASALGISATAPAAGQTGQGGQGADGGRRGGSPIDDALRITGSRNTRNWSQVWGAVNNNRNAVRLLADVLTLPNDSTQSGSGAGGGQGGGGQGGGGQGGGGGRDGGGGPGRGGPGGGGPGGGRPGGGGGPGGGGPGGGGPGGGPRGGPGGGRGASGLALPRYGVMPALFELEPPGGAGGGTAVRLASFEIRLAQAGTPGGSPPGTPGGNQPGSSGDTGQGNTDAISPDVPVEPPVEPIEGAVNLNTAPPEVLMSLPQMTEQVAQAIVDYRQSTPFLSRGDLLIVPGTGGTAGGSSSGTTGGNTAGSRTTGQYAVSQQLFNAIVERVTVVSDSYTVRVLGFGHTLNSTTGVPNDIAVHLTATLDRSSGRCRIVRLRQDN
jgi:DNA uptake protein ComE-like DNA-binding protein